MVNSPNDVGMKSPMGETTKTDSGRQRKVGETGFGKREGLRQTADYSEAHKKKRVCQAER